LERRNKNVFALIKSSEKYRKRGKWAREKGTCRGLLAETAKNQTDGQKNGGKRATPFPHKKNAAGILSF